MASVVVVVSRCCWCHGHGGGGGGGGMKKEATSQFVKVALCSNSHMTSPANDLT